MATNVYGNGTTSATVGGYNTTTLTNEGNTVVHFYDRAGVKAANRVNLYGQFADRKSMPKKMGKTFKISKFLHIYDRALNDAEFSEKGYLSHRTVTEVSDGLSNSVLGEGAGAINKRSLQKITMETTLARYGEMIDYTDEVELFSEDTMQVRYREELGELANSRMEDLLQLDMLATPTVMCAGPALVMADIDEDSQVSYDTIRKAVRKLVRNRAKKNTSVVSGSTKIDTRTIDKAYYAIIGANVKGDLELLTRGAGSEKEFVYLPVHKYAAAGSLVEGEVGAMHEVRFIESEAAVVYPGAGQEATVGNVGDLSYTGTLGVDAAFDVFPILFPTQGCFATVGLKGQGKIKFNSKSPAEVELINPYGTSGFFSYNFFYAGIILEEEKLLKVLVSASA
jgi:N4-gp56 family major capsid protein